MAGSGVKIDLGKVSGNLDRLGERAPIVMGGVAGRRADIAEKFMKQNASWTDRTGNARAGLRAVASATLKSVQIDLFHSVPYGIWLEVRWAGRYSIIPLAVKEAGTGMMEDLAALFARLR